MICNTEITGILETLPPQMGEGNEKSEDSLKASSCNEPCYNATYCTHSMPAVQRIFSLFPLCRSFLLLATICRMGIEEHTDESVFPIRKALKA